MTAAASAVEELRQKQYLTDKGLRIVLRRIEPDTKHTLSEMYYANVTEALEDAKKGTVECYYELRLLHGDKLLRRVRGGL